MDANSHPFSRDVHARNISNHGAKFSGLEEQLTPGDIIGVHFANKKARCTVMSVADAGPVRKLEVGVRLVEGQTCPWEKEIETQQATEPTPICGAAKRAAEKRKFPRQRIPFPVEIRDEGDVGVRMSTNTADIAGSGCYIETRMPLPVNKVLGVTFWMNSEPVHTAAIVRTCDGGVGMGIEFTSLDEVTQKQLQQHVETMAAESAPLPAGHGLVLTSLFPFSTKS